MPYSFWSYVGLSDLEFDVFRVTEGQNLIVPAMLSLKQETLCIRVSNLPLTHPL